jgi:hypothetical protein
MRRTAWFRLGLIAIALAAIVLGLNLMNVRNDVALLAGALATLGGFGLGGWQVWNLVKETLQ